MLKCKAIETSSIVQTKEQQKCHITIKI